MFDPKLKVGQVFSNEEIAEIFNCEAEGRMRRSYGTNSMVIISDYTQGLFHDKWIGGVLHYQGMGETGDQSLYSVQNMTLAECGSNGVDVHLFELLEPDGYTYCGKIEPAFKPYTEVLPGADGNDRKVWIFPIKPVTEKNVPKPSLFVFADMGEYIARGENAEQEFAGMLAEGGGRVSFSARASAGQKDVAKPAMVIPEDIVGKSVRHRSFGLGVVSERSKTTITVEFEKAGTKKMGYEMCVKNNLLEIL